MVALSSIILSALSLAIVYISCQIIYYKLFHPLRHYPGPFWAGVTTLWTAWHVFWGRETLLHWEIREKYGPVIRVEPNLLLFTESSAILKIYNRRATKTNFFPQEFWDTPASALISDPFQHAAHRRLVASAYAMSNIQRMESLISKSIIHWIGKLRTICATPKKPTDLSKWATFLSYDSITDLAFRYPVGYIEAGADVNGLIEAFHSGCRVIGAAARISGLLQFVVRLPVGKRFKVGSEGSPFFRNLTEHASKVLDTRNKALAEGLTPKSEEGEAAYDFVQAFFDARTPDGHQLSKNIIQAEVWLILGAGADGFGSVCSSLLAEILSQPAIYARVIKEIKVAVESGHLSTPVPTYNEVAKHLPFYRACVSEALRLHPSSSSILPRRVTALDPEIIVNGRRIPIGAQVGSNPFICHREKALYGEDAEDFNPDRWLGDPERVKLFDKYNLTFGAGTRVCLGKHFAMVMLYKAPVAPEREFSGPLMTWKNVWINLKEREPWVATNGQHF
ncbi:putative P450 monooxygenase [Aspergillus stella-maris]|uniref:putative P450 monooxygenase n=1 Tax=Aspergillus stella-maris TaxID=1810926 RepID=UPI003CCD6D42